MSRLPVKRSRSRRGSTAYTPSDGTLQGKVSGNTLTLKWAQPGFTGTGTFTMLDTKPKTFRGTILTDGKAGTVVWNGSLSD